MKTKPPAFLSHAPASIVYESVSNEVLFNLLGGISPDQLERMQFTAYDFPFGFYRLTRHGKPHTFIKLLPMTFEKIERFSLELEKMIHDQGMVARCLAFSTMEFNGVPLCCIRGEYIEFVQFDAQYHSLDLLGRHLKLVHQFLSSFDATLQAKTNWLERKSGFDEVWCLLQQPQYANGFRQPGLVVTGSELEQFLNYYELLNFDLDCAQMIHGDLNPGNVLWTQKGPLIIDFENAAYSFMPAYFDLAMLAQRLLVSIHDPKQRLAMWRDLCQGYGLVDTLSLVDGMLAMSVRSMAVLLERAVIHQQSIAQSEWDKFVLLIQDANSYRG